MTTITINGKRVYYKAIDDVVEGRDIRDDPYVWKLKTNKDFEYI